MNSQEITRYIQIDEEGFFLNAGTRYTDEAFGAGLLNKLHYDNRALLTESDGEKVIVEAFSEPLVARHIMKEWSGTGLDLEFPYGVKGPLDLSHLHVDEWDRFRGYFTLSTGAIVPYVLARSAQADLFELAESFDDDSITISGKTFPVKPWYSSDEEVDDPDFWSQLYANWKDDSSKPGWELQEPASALRDISSQLKLNKARLLVLGCGSGHDAAFFAQQGHHVTAIDFSDEALARAAKNYGSIKNLQFKKADFFDLPESMKGQFDIVFDHTFMSAIHPDERRDVVRIYRQLLSPGGHILGIFMILNPKCGPPFGMTEWELREFFKGKFHSLYWTRWRKSIAPRAGKELVVYAQAKELS